MKNEKLTSVKITQPLFDEFKIVVKELDQSLEE